jgi:hypothetical protein
MREKTAPFVEITLVSASGFFHAPTQTSSTACVSPLLSAMIVTEIHDVDHGGNDHRCDLKYLVPKLKF